MLFNGDLLEIPDGISMRFTVGNYALDELDIRSPYDERILRQQVTRIWPAWSSPAISGDYFDVVSIKLQGRLIARLFDAAALGTVFTLTKHGEGRSSEWELATEPAP